MLQPAFINGCTFDLDGHEENTKWEIKNKLTLNVDNLDASMTKPNRFHGEMTIGAASALSQGQANINLPKGSSWTMMGELNLQGSSIGFSKRLGGSPMVLAGELNGTGGSSVSADVTFANLSMTSLPNQNDQLVLSAKSTLYPDAGFSGNGLLRNSGAMELMSGVDTGQIRVKNDAVLGVTGVDTANVGAFENSEDATVVFDIGWDGQEATVGQLSALSDANLAGTISLSMVEGVDLYETVAVIMANDGVTGTFDAVDMKTPETGVGLAVTYEPFSVNVTPALVGDANMNGSVEFLDFLVLAENFGERGTWVDGDFDGDGEVAFLDFLGLAESFGMSADVSVAPVPEPSSLAMAWFLFGMLTLRRRTR